MKETVPSTDNTLALENTGDHHQIRLTLDPETKHVNAGAILNFSDHAAVGLQVVDGKAFGTLAHSGDTHSLVINAQKDGSFHGTYKDEKNGIEIELDGDEAVLKKGKIPAAGISWQGDHHAIHFLRNQDGKLMGSIGSTNTGGNQFKLAIDDGKLTGAFVHTGKNHETAVSLNQDGWKANISAGKGDLKWDVGIERGRVEKKVFAGVRWRF